MIKINYPLDRNLFHKKYILELGITDDMRKRFLKLMSKNPLNRFGINLLDYILLAPFEELLRISLSYPLTLNEKNAFKLFFNYDYKSKDKFQPKIKSFFEKELIIKTCYFCNMDFVNSFEDRSDYHNFEDFIKRASEKELIKLKGIGDKKLKIIIAQRNDIDNSRFIQNLLKKHNEIVLEKKYSHFTLDHVLDKGSHPLIALSLEW